MHSGRRVVEQCCRVGGRWADVGGVVSEGGEGSCGAE
ncbi:hypothetical protein ERO13_A01G049233v2 [Gossypium hirsutum]|uniref:Uncharacterized protein n=1 Tax=Gossypium darwinii TaxID=34276 RepID=A0A5D2HIH1_GOSDA|nr:hypothetical protein ERO13_A01G049233v2 [Gossypium hirsutum]TYH29918.1 hypothetical protein ES288_A01G051700v1 [Gossypium darwinii]